MRSVKNFAEGNTAANMQRRFDLLLNGPKSKKGKWIKKIQTRNCAHALLHPPSKALSIFFFPISPQHLIFKENPIYDSFAFRSSLTTVRKRAFLSRKEFFFHATFVKRAKKSPGHMTCGTPLSLFEKYSHSLMFASNWLRMHGCKWR